MSNIFIPVIMAFVCIACVWFLYFDFKSFLYDKKTRTEYRRPAAFTIVDCISTTLLVALLLASVALILINLLSL